MTKTNPLIGHYGIPQFADIAPEHIGPAVAELIARVDALQEQMEAVTEPTWQNVLVPLAQIEREIDATWLPVVHLNSVANSDSIREAYEQNQGAIVASGLKLNQSATIYRHLKTIRKSAAFASMTSAQQRTIDKKIQSAELSGIQLEGEAKARFNDISKRLSQLSTNFSNNVLDSNKAFCLVIDKEADMAGLPDTYRELASGLHRQRFPDHQPAATAEAGPWAITLDYPSAGPFYRFAENRELRETLYRAQIAKASTGDYDNGPLMLEILKLRKQKSELLGFENFAALSLASKMAGSADKVSELLDQIKAKSLPGQAKEQQQLQDFAAKCGLEGPIRHWDASYYAERQKEQLYAYKEEDIKPYFPIDSVLKGMFDLCERLFGFRTEKVDCASRNIAAWDKDVTYYELITSSGQHLASFFLDPFSRPASKRGGAWMLPCVTRHSFDGQVTEATAYVNCNFTPPSPAQDGGEDLPSLLTFSEVTTLFHEYGHALQHMLSTVDEISVSGIGGIEWDAVEIASQFMENWCYHKPTLLSLSGHYQTGETLPEAFFDKILAAKNYRTSTFSLRQLHFAYTDMALHSAYDPESDSESPKDIADRLGAELLPIAPLPENQFLKSFSHIFAGGYAAGYYSYKWAEVLSSDAFGRFEEADMNDATALRTIGKQYQDSFLALGGSVHPLEVFKSFRGREPEIDAYLRHQGIAS